MNTLRITGLATGIDTDEMVQSLMKAERIKVNKVEQDKQLALWRQEMYNDINKAFANFILNTRKLFGLTEVTRYGTFRTNSYQNLSWVKKATSSNENIATVSVAAKALDGTYKVEVEQLAEGVSLASSEDIRSIINDDGKIIDESKNLIQEIKFTISDGKNSIDIEIINENGITMNDIVREINSREELGIKASYDAGIGRFFLQTTGTGSEARIDISAEGEGKNFINALKLGYMKKGENGQYVYEEFKIDENNKAFVQGQDAIISFNGARGITSSSNRITINGITMNLTDIGEFTITVSTDVDGIIEKIEKFIEEYNQLVDMTNKVLSEKRYRDYLPLTAEQKKEMEKEDIELWEEKAKSGLLRNDEIISRTMLKVRQSLYEKFTVEEGFSGVYSLITDIGIGTEEYSRGSAGGRIKIIDRQKLEEALIKNPEAVLEMLFKESEPPTKNEDGTYNNDGKKGGILARIHDNLMGGMEEIIKKSGTGEDADLYRSVRGNMLLDFVTEFGSISLLDRDVLRYNRRIDDLNDMLIRKENSYYAQFTALERAIARMNQQSLWLMQQFMGQ